MNKIKSIALAGVAALFAAMPSFARVEPKTTQLLATVQSSGIAITYNGENCTGNYLGKYRFLGMRRQMILCPGRTVDPVDHATVRHEVWHAIQHCVNTMRQTPLNTPVVNDLDKLTEVINQGLSVEQVNFIKANYPVEHWWVVFEANLAESMTAEQIEEMFVNACLA